MKKQEGRLTYTARMDAPQCCGWTVKVTDDWGRSVTLELMAATPKALTASIRSELKRNGVPVKALTRV